MTQGKYMHEDTQALIRRAESILGETPIIDITNWQTPIETPLNLDGGGSCSRITLKNTITITDTNILVCTGTTTTTCSPAGSCPTGGIVAPTKYINMLATVNLVGIAQSGVVIQFNYLVNDVPITDPSLTQVTVSLIPGNNSVYLFPTNHTYSPSTSITLYGATVVSY